MTARVDDAPPRGRAPRGRDPRGRRQRRAARARSRPGARLTDGRRPARALLEGGPIADEIRRAVAEDVATLHATPAAAARACAVVIVGRDAPSTVYLEQILRGCAKVGIDAGFVELEGEATEAPRRPRPIRELNADPAVDGVIVQMPLPPTIRLRAVIDAIDPAKDIDGIHPLNAGLLRLGYDGFLPATAHAAVEILRRSGIEIAGHGRGRHRPLARSSACRPRSCWSRRTRRSRSATRGRATSPRHVARADIVVVAAGHPGLVTGDDAQARARSSSTSASTSSTAGSSATSTSSRPSTVASAITPGPGRRRPADQRAPADPPDPRRRAPGRPRRAPTAPTSPRRRDRRHPPRRSMSFPSDLEIARSVTPRPIVDIAARPRHRATTSSSCTARPRPRSRSRRSRGSRPSGRAASTSSSPRSRRRRSARASRRRPSGSPRASTTSASKAAVNIRQPSLGPVFGIKGGAAGGGYSQVIPMEDFNLHLTGDVHAIGAAHNLAGAFIDNSLHHKNPLGIDPHGDPLAARRRHQRPGAAPRRHRPRRARGRRPARDRVRHHGRLRGHGGPRPRHRPARPARAARADRPGDDDRRDAGHRRGPRRRRRR